MNKDSIIIIIIIFIITVQSIGGEKAVRQGTKTYKRGLEKAVKRKAVQVLAGSKAKRTRDIFE